MSKGSSKYWDSVRKRWRIVQMLHSSLSRNIRLGSKVPNGRFSTHTTNWRGGIARNATRICVWRTLRVREQTTRFSFHFPSFKFKIYWNFWIIFFPCSLSTELKKISVSKWNYPVFIKTSLYIQMKYAVII